MDLVNREWYHRSAGVKTTGKINLTKKIIKKIKLSNHCTVGWVTQPELPKGVKDVIKQAQRAATGGPQPEGPNRRAPTGGPLDF